CTLNTLDDHPDDTQKALELNSSRDKADHKMRFSDKSRPKNTSPVEHHGTMIKVKSIMTA
ncbi:hypothetical protein AB4501_32435, partial [Vibrio sp. 10N.222.55.E8]